MVFGFLRRKRELSHADVRELLSVYLDERLSPDQAAKVETHLSRCGSCRNELESLRATRQLLQLLPAVRPPRSFTLEAAPRPVALPRSFFYLRAATAVAAAAFAALVAVRAVLPMAGLPAAAPDVYRATLATAPAAAPAALEEPKAAPALRQPAAEVGSLSAPAQAAAPTPAPAPVAPRAAPAAKAAAPTEGAAAPALRAAQVAPTQEPAADAAAPLAGATPAPAAAAAAAPAQPERAAVAAPGAPAATEPAVAQSGALPIAPATAASGPGAAPAVSEAVSPGVTSGGAGQPGESVAKGAEQGSSAEERNAALALPRAAEPPGPSAPSESLPLLSFLQIIQAAVGALVVVLGVATGAIWWRYRRRSP